VFDVNGKVSAYTLTHPWRYAEPPALNVMLGEIPARPSTYYIHDLALTPEARGSGAGAAIVEAVIAHAEKTGVPNLSLVAVNNSVPFWSRFGFEVVAEPKLVEKLLSYDADARFMVRKISA
jgi:N-acetylglutamate synthase-like GNAT family acetyltransferase